MTLSAELLQKTLNLKGDKEGNGGQELKVQ